MRDPSTVNVLVACEESQTACKAFRERGFNAFSCDIQEPSGGHPEWHILGDALESMRGGQLSTMDGHKHTVPKWDLVIAHPPCTYLTVAGNRWFDVSKYGDKARQREKERFKAIVFFMRCVYANARHTAVENPVGIMGTCYQKATQIIQPYEYGHPVRKGTCLWLKDLPPLQPTEIVDFEIIHSKGKSGGYSGASWYVKDKNGKILRFNDPMTAKARSKTYQGIAAAMAEQWGDYILNKE